MPPSKRNGAGSNQACTSTAGNSLARRKAICIEPRRDTARHYFLMGPPYFLAEREKIRKLRFCGRRKVLRHRVPLFRCPQLQKAARKDRCLFRSAHAGTAHENMDFMSSCGETTHHAPIFFEKQSMFISAQCLSSKANLVLCARHWSLAVARPDRARGPRQRRRPVAVHGLAWPPRRARWPPRRRAENPRCRRGRRRPRSCTRASLRARPAKSDASEHACTHAPRRGLYCRERGVCGHADCACAGAKGRNRWGHARAGTGRL